MRDIFADPAGEGGGGLPWQGTLNGPLVWTHRKIGELEAFSYTGQLSGIEMVKSLKQTFLPPAPWAGR